MSYKTQCGNAAFFWLRFHTIIKKYSDYQRVTFQPVAASRRVTLETLRPLKKKLELKDRENRVFEHDSTFFTFRLNNRFSESYFYR